MPACVPFVTQKLTKDENTCNDGGLARSSEQRSARKLKQLHDVFEADVFYHKNCYSSFTYTYMKSQKEVATSERESRALEVLMRCLREVLSKTKNHIS